MLFVHEVSVQYVVRVVNFGVLLLLPLVCTAQVTMVELRSFQEKALIDEVYAFELYERLTSETKKSELKNGYLGVLEAMLAEHTFNPYKKLTYFNSGKKKLETAISMDSLNVELRYLRLGMQLNVPGFLGYNSSIEKDKTFIVANLFEQKTQLGKLYTKIIDFLIASEMCTDEEKIQLKEIK